MFISNYFRGEKNGVRVGCYFINPGCSCGNVLLQVGRTEDQYPGFDFDGNLENPTFNPSVFPYPEKCSEENGDQRCHFFVRKGIAEHCSDSKFAGQKVTLLKVTYQKAYDALGFYSPEKIKDFDIKVYASEEAWKESKT